ncbi:glycosyltransferase family 2 protein [bacterium]|nr:glycosyltransferase family 2 protein [bacterium]
MSEIIFAIPFYDEELNIIPLIEKIRKLSVSGYTTFIIAVDDGSTDNTPQVLKDLSGPDMKIITHLKNQGLGKTLKDAFFSAHNYSKKTSTHKTNILVTLDGDNTHDPAYLNEMAQKIQIEHKDVVVASRYRIGSEIHGVPLHRKILSVIASFIFKVCKPIPGIRDYSCGFRAFSMAFIDKALLKFGTNLIRLDGFACTLELLLKLSTLNGNLSEIPFDLRYDFKKSESKIKIISTSLVYLKFLFKDRNHL